MISFNSPGISRDSSGVDIGNSVGAPATTFAIGHHGGAHVAVSNQSLAHHTMSSCSVKTYRNYSMHISSYITVFRLLAL